MATTNRLKVEVLTCEAFEPFGQFIGADGRQPDFEGLSGTRIWSLDFETDGRVQLGFIRVPYQRLAFKMRLFVEVSG